MPIDALRRLLSINHAIAIAFYRREIELATSRAELKSIARRARQEDAAINKWLALGGPFPALG